MADLKQELLRGLPSISTLLATSQGRQWVNRWPQGLVAECLRQTVEDIRRQIIDDAGGRCGPAHVSEAYILQQAEALLEERTAAHIRRAINATGIILHTGLGRSVYPEAVVDSLVEELKSYVTLAIDRQTGTRSERHLRVEYVLTELTGAQSATVVNNNAAATLLVLAALAAGREVIVSRGQLIEIGGSFRLPEVMAQSGARLVEVGTTNRTHLRDYAAAITDNTAAILRVHPSNYRVVGFTSQPELAELAGLAHQRGILLIDDPGAGALVGLEKYGLPHEPTIAESIAAGADVVLASTDKLIGGPQGGLIVGGRAHLDQIRRHPLARALRADKTCLMILERTLHLFRDGDKLAQTHPLYRALAQSAGELEARAKRLAELVGAAAPCLKIEVRPDVGYLGSGSLPMEQLPTFVVALTPGGDTKPAALARLLRMDPACIFTRIENEQVILDVRTIQDKELQQIAAAAGRICRQAT
jgi:L-seryl-tRNA(Ser) seleniumtransferase